jgi:hypothetical protein
VLTDVFVASAPAGSGGTGSVVVLGGRCAVLPVDARRWTDLRGSGVSCIRSLDRPVGVPSSALPAAGPAARNAVPQNARPTTTHTPIDHAPIDTFDTPLGIHLPRRPTS